MCVQPSTPKDADRLGRLWQTIRPLVQSQHLQAKYLKICPSERQVTFCSVKTDKDIKEDKTMWHRYGADLFL